MIIRSYITYFYGSEMSPPKVTRTPKKETKMVPVPGSAVAVADPDDTGEWFLKSDFRRVGDDSEYTKIKHVKHPMYTAVNELGQLVGSRFKRDIKRREAFISPKTFEEWNKTTGKNRYIGRYEDFDDDGVNEEFVVRRKRFKKDGSVKLDEDGNPILSDAIAVNGWTTMKSDYPIRKQYYDTYITADARSATPYTQFIKDHYLTEDMIGRTGLPNHKYLDKRRIDTYQNYQYNLRMPNPTAKQMFMKEIIYPAFMFTVKDIADNLKIRTKDVLDEIKGPGLAGKIGKIYFDKWIKKPYMDSMKTEGYLDAQLLKYRNKISEKARNSPNFDANFEKWLFKQDSVREGLNEIIFDCVQNKSEKDDAIFALYMVFHPAILQEMNKPVKSSPPRNKSQYRKRLRMMELEPEELDNPEYDDE